MGTFTLFKVTGCIIKVGKELGSPHERTLPEIPPKALVLVCP